MDEEGVVDEKVGVVDKDVPVEDEAREKVLG